ncbi:unnamed protein product [marine sediment metagenome]|uniref:Uncharacterized protein n=1 Tax=marine sediment metagenome TaxID=412755 RepID=X0UC99_9ZZZZ
MRNRKLRPDEADLMRLVFERNDFPDSPARKRLLWRARIKIIVQEPFTMVYVSAKFNGRTKPCEFYGFSKQCRYAKCADPWDEEKGKRIALSRVAHQMCE